MIRLHVWVRRHPQRASLAGEIAMTDADTQGRFRAEFAYDDAWLRDPQGFDLDPASVRRDGGPRFGAESFDPPLGLFEDALPDDWGRRLMARGLQSRGIRPSHPEMLRALGAGGLGALAFSDDASAPAPQPTAPSHALAELAQAAGAFERGARLADDRFLALLKAGSTAGGARPKALVQDAGIEYIAKFPSESKDHGHDVVGLEAVGLELARRAGLAVAQARLAAIGKRRVLLVRRFDVASDGRRLHMLSLRTLCRERPGLYVTGYRDLAAAVRKYSAAPADDVRTLFRHAAFNAAFGNVDDHTKNFWMQHRSEGWRLAPAFDLVPDIRENLEHALAFDLHARCPPRDEMLEVGRRWKVAEPERVLDEVCAAVAEFAQACAELGVRHRVDEIGRDISRRLRLLDPSRAAG